MARRKPLKQRSKDATACTRAACKRVGLYKRRQLTDAQFRELKCRDLVKGAKATCPLSPAGYTLPLKVFREALRECLKEKGHSRPILMLQILCATKTVGGRRINFTWGDWCNHLAGRL